MLLLSLYNIAHSSCVRTYSACNTCSLYYTTHGRGVYSVGPESFFSVGSLCHANSAVDLRPSKLNCHRSPFFISLMIKHGRMLKNSGLRHYFMYVKKVRRFSKTFFSAGYYPYMLLILYYTVYKCLNVHTVHTTHAPYITLHTVEVFIQ